MTKTYAALLAAMALTTLAAACAKDATTSSSGAGGATAASTTTTGAATTTVTTTTVTTTSAAASTTTTTTSNASSSSGGASGCTEITLGAASSTGADGSSAIYVALATPDLGDTTDHDEANLGFYGSSYATGFNGENKGTFDLAAAGDNNYGTCSRCLLFYRDPSATSPTLFFPQSGTLVVNASSDQLNGTLNATLTNVTLIQVTINTTTYVSTPVPGGACLHIASAALSVGSP